ncbi:site-specific tyrosine recombinase XerD [Kingella kingae]|uniref:site-specific tyrosine recombinase XerD n=1 Tax=Kingella kingae TaxID=504 RepID=UPI0004126B3D|nr:site-specific tyrosine recombinase XerD [Kingella kingae]MDK4568068.1 site-specific tyrosine recombinase XerD [Kingella kingae]MDK4571210.1 site-specific tyrosine recombinase XerD [Kingella kingae]MDK4571978.1 site-specific tyrosine recombinase XerD [Kingella kingae]MDK4580105.1 site-specific tyrosine recombinase XerD [Kingella kingae]
MNPTNTEIIESLLDHLWLQERLADNTLQAYRRDLNKLATRLQQENTDFLHASSLQLASAIYLADESPRTQSRCLSAAKRLYAWLIEQGKRADNPCRDLKTAKLPRTLPQLITEAQIDALLAAPNVDTPHGLRDKALLELMYATGLRVSEAVGLRLHELKLLQGMVSIIGKGDKQRIVPLGEEAIFWLERYLHEARDTLLKGANCDAVFVSQKRNGITRQLAWMAVNKYAQQVGIVGLSPHGLRHAFATHLVNHGADLRVVQLLLGHANLTTTEIYTHVANVRLKQVVDTHHPRS